MGLVSTWLRTVGLGHVVPAFRMAGINTPTALAQLEMRDYEELGVTDWNDKRKLLYLVQRIQVARDDNEKNSRNEKQHYSEEEFYSHDEEDDELQEKYSYEREQQKPRTPSQTAAAALAEWSAAEDYEENPDISSNSTLPSPPEYSDHDQYEEDFEDYELMDEKIQRKHHIRESLNSERPASSSMRLLKSKQTRRNLNDQRSHQSNYNQYIQDSSDQYNNKESDSQIYSLGLKSPSRGSDDDFEDNNSYPKKISSKPRKSMSFDAYQDNHQSFRRRNKHTNKKDILREHQMHQPLNTKKKVRGERNALNEEHHKSPNSRNVLKSHSYDNFDLESPSFESETRTRPSTTYTHPKSHKTRSSFHSNSRQYASGESLRSHGRSMDRHTREEDEGPFSTSSPRTRASSRRMSQRLKDRNMRTKMRRDIERQPSVTEDEKLENDFSDNSRSNNYSRSRQNDQRRRDHNHHVYSEEEDYEEEYSENDEDDEEIRYIRERSKSNSRKSILTMTSPIMTSKVKERRRVSSAHSAPSAPSTISSSIQSSKNQHRDINSRPKSRRQNAGTRLQNHEHGTRSSHRNAKDNFTEDYESINTASRLYLGDHNPENPKQTKDRPNPSKIPSMSSSTQRRRIQSNIQNPSISYRNGNKMLSSIPSEKAAPMSPLVEISSSKLDKIQFGEKDERQSNNENTLEMGRKTRVSKGKNKSRRESSIGSGEYRSSISSRKGNSSRRQSAPISQISFDEDQNDFDEERSFLSREKSTGSLNSDRRISTGSLSSQSNSSRRSFSRSEPTISKTMLNNTRSMRRRAARQRSFDEVESKDDEVMNQLSPNKRKDPTPVFVHGLPEDNSWSTQVSRLREDVEDEYSNTLKNEKEEEALEMRIRVVVRKRPMSKKESSVNDVDIIHPINDKDFGRIAVYQAKTRVDLTKEVETLKFSFDNVFGEKSNNIDIYNRAVRHLIPGVFEGLWASIFAYGQTGSGKTFTMMGCGLTGNKAGTQTKKRNENQGLYYSAAEDVFHLAKLDQYKHLSVGVSLFEIYGGKLFDLLNKRKSVKCLEDHKGKVCFPGLSEHPISNPDELLQMIETGATNRSTGTTSANADSSRSHAVLMLSLRKRVGRKGNIEHGRLSFIDLAGSERGADTAKACRTTRMEGAEINTSLLALKEVIRALATGGSMKHIPFRGSKLTQVLKESFVGKNSRTVMVACVAPNMNNCDHTLNTLRYADRVKERDPETGKLSDKIMAASKMTKIVAPVSLLERPSTAPATSLERKMSMKRIDESKSPVQALKKLNNEPNEEVEWSFEDDSEDEKLNTRSIESPDEQKYYLPQSSDEEDTSPEKYDIEYNKEVRLKEASSSLVNTHKNIMTGMLNTVKLEMSLVNSTDADRNTIEDYLIDLERVLDNNSSMITTLRESLLEYYAARGEMQQSSQNIFASSQQITSNIDDGMLSDDTFEDLRD